MIPSSGLAGPLLWKFRSERMSFFKANILINSYTLPGLLLNVTFKRYERSKNGQEDCSLVLSGSTERNTGFLLKLNGTISLE